MLRQFIIRDMLIILMKSGFVEKTKMKDGPYLEKSNKTMIKEVLNLKTSEKIAEEVVIENDNQGE